MDISKFDATKRQLDTAINLYFKDADPVYRYEKKQTGFKSSGNRRKGILSGKFCKRT